MYVLCLAEGNGGIGWCTDCGGEKNVSLHTSTYRISAITTLTIN